MRTGGILAGILGVFFGSALLEEVSPRNLTINLPEIGLRLRPPDFMLDLIKNNLNMGSGRDGSGGTFDPDQEFLAINHPIPQNRANGDSKGVSDVYIHIGSAITDFEAKYFDLLERGNFDFSLSREREFNFRQVKNTAKREFNSRPDQIYIRSSLDTRLLSIPWEFGYSPGYHFKNPEVNRVEVFPLPSIEGYRIANVSVSFADTQSIRGKRVESVILMESHSNHLAAFIWDPEWAPYRPRDVSVEINLEPIQTLHSDRLQRAQQRVSTPVDLGALKEVVNTEFSSMKDNPFVKELEQAIQLKTTLHLGDLADLIHRNTVYTFDQGPSLRFNRSTRARELKIFEIDDVFHFQCTGANVLNIATLNHYFDLAQTSESTGFPQFNQASSNPIPLSNHLRARPIVGFGLEPLEDDERSFIRAKVGHVRTEISSIETGPYLSIANSFYSVIYDATPSGTPQPSDGTNHESPKEPLPLGEPPKDQPWLRPERARLRGEETNRDLIDQESLAELVHNETNANQPQDLRALQLFIEELQKLRIQYIQFFEEESVHNEILNQLISTRGTTYRLQPIPGLEDLEIIAQLISALDGSKPIFFSDLTGQLIKKNLGEGSLVNSTDNDPIGHLLDFFAEHFQNLGRTMTRISNQDIMGTLDPKISWMRYLGHSSFRSLNRSLQRTLESPDWDLVKERIDQLKKQSMKLQKKCADYI